jgi:hypothetical protein
MRVALRPVDGVRVTALIDNSSDAPLPDEGWSGGGGCGTRQAMHALARELPGAFRPDAVGSRFTL